MKIKIFMEFMMNLKNSIMMAAMVASLQTSQTWASNDFEHVWETESDSERDGQSGRHSPSSVNTLNAEEEAIRKEIRLSRAEEMLNIYQDKISILTASQRNLEKQVMALTTIIERMQHLDKNNSFNVKEVVNQLGNWTGSYRLKDGTNVEHTPEIINIEGFNSTGPLIGIPDCNIKNKGIIKTRYVDHYNGNIFTPKLAVDMPQNIFEDLLRNFDLLAE